MGVFARVFGIIILVFVIFQFIPYGKDKTNPKTDKAFEITASENIKNILKKSCYDCHSNETKWPWYSYIAPISWSIFDHVKHGRRAVNFNEWENYTKDKKLKIKKSIFRTVRNAMPLSQYTFIHTDAKLNKKDIKDIQNWVSNGEGFVQFDIR